MTANAVEQAIHAERQRIRTILELEEANGREPVAIELCRSDVNPETARTILAKSPRQEAPQSYAELAMADFIRENRPDKD